MEKPIAYMNWLVRAGKDRDTISKLIYQDILCQGELAFGLLENTGDKNYTKETFLKAADMVIKEVKDK